MAAHQQSPRRKQNRHASPFALEPPQYVPRPLPMVRWTERTGSALRPDPLQELLGQPIDQLDLVAHCPVGSRFRPATDGTESVAVYAETAPLLRAELSARSSRPRAVVVGRGSDPFLPFCEVQQEACRVAATLAELGVETWFRTRGCVRPFALDTLAPLASAVHLTLLVSTAHERLRRALFPLSAPVQMQLKQLRCLRAAHLTSHVSLEPLLHGLTDTRDNLEPLLDELAEAGVEQVSAGYLVLRWGAANELSKRFLPAGWFERLAEPYRLGPILRLPGAGRVQLLPKPTRQRGYALLMSLAAQRGIGVQLDPVANPDFVDAYVRPMRRRPRQQLLAFASA